MVETAMILPNDVVENVAHRHGEVSIEAVRETYTEKEISRLQRRARDECDEVMVLAALEDEERERVEKAATEAGKHSVVWLAETTTDVVPETGPMAHPETLSEQVERAIFQRTEV
jgi:uncharacterized protein YegJ (DUF2314 family)